MTYADDPVRLEIYFDHYNIYKHIREGELMLDYIEMVNRLAEGRHITEKFVFDSRVRYGFDPLRKTHDWMRNNGFIVFLRYCDPNKQVQKGVDMTMGLEIQRRAYENRFDVALMITGDGDFAPVCEYIRRLGKKVEVAAFDEILSSDLKSVVDRYHDLKNIASPRFIEPDKDKITLTESELAGECY